MENLLKRQLAQIKMRALWLRRRAEACGEPVAASPEIVDAVVATGAVMRGARAERLAPRSRVLWWRRWAGHAEAGFEADFQRAMAALLSGEPVEFEHAVPGEPRTIEKATFYLVESAGRDIDPGSPGEAARFASLGGWPEDVRCTTVGIRRPGIPFDSEPPPFRSAGSALFLDIETAGLSANTYVFLCGLMCLAGGDFHIAQVVARDYAEEEGLLRYVRAMFDRYDTVVTYNGASFDLPFLRTRMAVHRIPDVERIGSVDLLHPSRRAFREILPNCRLVTVERHLRGVDRVDDIPSRFIPRAYHEYVRTRDARIMRNVVYHNRMDLFTMAVILNHLAGPGGRPFPPFLEGDTMAARNSMDVPF